MKTTIDGEIQRVVYIEYNGNVPHTVYTAIFSPNCVTGPCWILMNWFDFFANGGDEKDIRHYNAGGGGSATEIDGPHWADGYIGEYWIDHEIAAFKSEPINGRELPKPKRLKDWYGSTSINPFKISEETSSRDYCEECGFESTEICWEHNYEDKDGNIRPKHAHHH